MKAYHVRVRLADHEWGSELMDLAAREVFAAHPDKEPMMVEVVEHAGWYLEYLRDGSVIGTANDGATTHLKDRLAFRDLTRDAEWVHLPAVDRPNLHPSEAH